ncbi:MAG: phage tail protein [Lentilitoribacter sp.]
MSKSTINEYSDNPVQNSDLALDGVLVDGYIDLSVRTIMAHLAQTDLAVSNNIVGQVAFFAKQDAPEGWLKANGALVSRTSYSQLFSAIGTLFGTGDGSTTFQLPDMRGEFVRGLDDGRGVDASRALAVHQSDELKAHEHLLEGPAGHTHGTQFANGAYPTTFSYIPDSVNSMSAYNDIWRTQETGGGETRPRNMAMLACIKY